MPRLMNRSSRQEHDSSAHRTGNRARVEHGKRVPIDLIGPAALETLVKSGRIATGGGTGLPPGVRQWSIRPGRRLASQRAERSRRETEGHAGEASMRRKMPNSAEGQAGGRNAVQPATERRPPMLEIPPADPIDPAQKRPPQAPGNAVISPDIGGIEDQFAGKRGHRRLPCYLMFMSLRPHQGPGGKQSSAGQDAISRKVTVWEACGKLVSEGDCLGSPSASTRPRAMENADSASSSVRPRLASSSPIKCCANCT